VYEGAARAPLEELGGLRATRHRPWRSGDPKAPQCGERKVVQSNKCQRAGLLAVDTVALDFRSIKMAEWKLALRQKCKLIFRLTYAAVLRVFGFTLALFFLSRLAASSAATAFCSFSVSTR
jgi:hypothetical protein